MELLIVKQCITKSRLNTRRIKHHANPPPNALRRQIPRKFTFDHSITSMCATHPSPVDSELGSILSSRSRDLGDVCDAFSEVELDVFLWIDSLDFDEGSVVVLVAEATFVSEDGAVYVEAGRLSVLFGHICVLLEKMHLGFCVEVRLDGC